MTCLHEYIQIYHSNEASKEICRFCHRKCITKFDKRGNYDARVYNEEHKRDFIQPWMKEAKRIKQ
jgi:hypothetical protein